MAFRNFPRWPPGAILDFRKLSFSIRSAVSEHPVKTGQHVSILYRIGRGREGEGRGNFAPTVISKSRRLCYGLVWPVRRVGLALIVYHSLYQHSWVHRNDTLYASLRCTQLHTSQWSHTLSIKNPGQKAGSGLWPVTRPDPTRSGPKLLTRWPDPLTRDSETRFHLCAAVMQVVK